MGIDRFQRFLNKEVSIAPLVIFRIAFGLLMFVSVSRFIIKGWVQTMYVMPKLFFPYYGFEWVKALPEKGMYLVFALLLLSSLGILLGAFYRLSAILFFVLFTYVELIDKTNYLNHYYFISLISFLLIFLPADQNFSLHNKWFNRRELQMVPRMYLWMPQLQMFVVYFFAGVAKINTDWLFEAQPLKIWLPAFSHFPLIGEWMEKESLAFVFCWFACIYDLMIGFFLFSRRWVYVAYVFVIVFHLATSMFFNIGMFPYIMITINIIFFREDLHRSVLNRLKRMVNYEGAANHKATYLPKITSIGVAAFVIYFTIQFLLPFRYLLYKGDLFWTEQGYRFSWRVMLMEKAGTAFFYVKDGKSGREVEVDNKEHLSYMQEKMMATQPDMMVDYARYLKLHYLKEGFSDPEVRVKSYVTLNGSGTKPFIDADIDLSKESNSFLKNKTWVRSY